VNLGVTGIPQRVKPPGPRSDPSARRQQDQYRQRYRKGEDDKGLQERLELFVGDESTDDPDKGDQLEKTEDACEYESSDMVLVSRHAGKEEAREREGRCDSPRAAMCSDVLTGKNPTKGTCILANVPITYQLEYAV
jgi:hypothetical protein